MELDRITVPVQRNFSTVCIWCNILPKKQAVSKNMFILSRTNWVGIPPTLVHYINNLMETCLANHKRNYICTTKITTK